MGRSFSPMCRCACQPSLKPYPAENSFLMTSKKKVSSPAKSKPAKAKPVSSKAPAKKATKSGPAPKEPAAKKPTSTKKKTVAAKSVKVAKAKQPAPKNLAKKSAKAVSSKAPAKKAAKSAAAPKAPAVKKTASVKKKAITAKSAKSGAVPKSAAKTEDSDTINKVKEIVSKSMRKSSKEESKAESNSFSFDDVLGFLKSKKKEKSKKQEAQTNTDAKLTKVEKAEDKKLSKVKKLTTASIDDILGFGSPVTGASRPLRDETKVPKQWLPYFQTLMALRKALKGSLDQRSSETIGASARESGELSINSSDAGTETFDRDLALSIVANDQDALEEIEDAIDRIFAGTYGVCLETNKPINKNRLKAVPFTRFSVEGQIQFERGRIKERDFGTGSFATLADSTMGEED